LKATDYTLRTVFSADAVAVYTGAALAKPLYLHALFHESADDPVPSANDNGRM